VINPRVNKKRFTGKKNLPPKSSSVFMDIEKASIIFPSDTEGIKE